MSSSDQAEVTFEKVKSNGAVVKKRVPTFRDGDWKDWLEWLLRLSEYYVFMGYAADDEEDQVAFVEDIQVLLFDEDLQQFNDTVAEESILRPMTVALVALQRLTEIHCPDGTRGVILDEMSALKKTRNVSVREYTRSFRKLGRMQNYITDNEAIPTSDVIRMYKSGMPIDWQIEVNRLSRSWEYNDLVHQFELIERNEQEEEVLRNGGRGSRSRSGQSAQQQQKGKNQGRGQAPRQNNQSSQPRGQPRQHRSDGNNGKYCKRNNHTDAECFRNPDSPAYRPRRPNNRGSGTNSSLSNGGSGNDRAFAAMQEQVVEMAAMMQEMKRRQEEELNALRFYRQDELSVIDAELVDEQPADDESAETLAPLRQQRTAPSVEQKPCLETEVRIGEQTFRALLDTGCTRSAIDQKIADTVEMGLKLRRQDGSYLMANRSVHKTTHVADTVFCLPAFSSKRECSYTLRLVDGLLHPVILGTDFLSSHGIDILFSANCLEWDDIRIPMHAPPPQAAKVSASAPMLGPQPPAAKAAKTEIDIDSMVEVAVSELVEALDPLMMIDGEMLSPSERVEVEHLVEAFLHVCSGGLGKINAKPYVILLKPGAKPFACRPYPIPQVHLEATKREIYRLVKLGILFPNNDSEWASPAFVIPKKDGSVRLVCDYRRLNRLLLRSFYPLPVIGELLRQFRKSKYVSSLDIPMSYYARILAEISRRLTAIVFPWGKYVFGCLPMGVNTAPDEFQSIMNMMLGDLDGVWAYLDDVLILSDSFEEHLELLRRVFERFEEFGLTIHPRKSKLFTTSTDCLGYRISTTGIQPLHNKVEAIAKIASPRTRRELRRFIGMGNY